MQQIIKSNFFIETKNEDWECGEDYDIDSCLNEGSGAFNVGVYSINSTVGQYAMKIILRVAALDRPEEIQRMYRNSQIQKLDRAETSIPFIFSFPTIVPLINFFIGDLKKVKHKIIEDRIELYKDSTAKLISKTTFIVMPIYDGTLRSFYENYVFKKQVSAQEELFVIYQLLMTLEHFSMNCILHGDLRPENILVYFADDQNPNYLKIGVADFGMAQSSTNQIFTEAIIQECRKNGVNQSYRPPEVVRYRLQPGKRGTISLWDVFQGFDSWSLGQSILELYCGRGMKQFETLRTEMQAEISKSQEEWEKWLQNKIGAAMHPALKAVCIILLSLEKTSRDIQECLTLLGSEIWMVPELQRNNDALNFNSEEKIQEGVFKVSQRLRVQFKQAILDNPSTNEWKEVCKIQWFAKHFVSYPDKDSKPADTFVKLSYLEFWQWVKIDAKKRQEKAKREALEIENWKSKKLWAANISSLSQVKMRECLGCTNDWISFLVTAEGIGDVVLNIMFNIGSGPWDNDSHLTYGSNLEIWESIPLHKNIVPILCKFYDKPSAPFLDHFPPDLIEFIMDFNGQPRLTPCFLTPYFASHLEIYYAHNYSATSLGEKLALIHDVMEALSFLFQHDIIHLNVNMRNVCVDWGRAIITDFMCAKRFLKNPSKQVYLQLRESCGGNPLHLAPEITMAKEGKHGKTLDYSKQPSFELGMLSCEIIFGDIPASNMALHGKYFGEELINSYSKCLDPKLFQWVKGLLLHNKEERTDLAASRLVLEEIIEEVRKKELIASYAEYLRQFFLSQPI